MLYETNLVTKSNLKCDSNFHRMLNSNWKEHDPENFFLRKENFILFYCRNNPYQISCVKFAAKFTLKKSLFMK